MTLTPTADRVIATALAQNGYREGRDKNGNWNNIQKFSPAVPGLEWSQGQAWCATFISWVAMEAGVADLFPRTASTDQGASWYQERDQWSEYPAIGAQGYLAHGHDEFHTFLVVKYDDTYIWTVEGNTNTTGSPQGNGVYELKRRRRDTVVEGYGYPAYPEGIISADPAWKDQAPKKGKKPVTKPKKSRKPVVGLSWNLLTKRNPGQVGKEVKALIRANTVNGARPHFLAVQEASQYRAVLHTVAALLGYRVYQPGNKGKKPKGVQVRGGGESALLIHRKVKVSQHGAIRCDKEWIGPKAGLVQEGRVLPWAVALLDNKWTLVVSVHTPTGRNRNAENKAAWDETLHKIEALAKSKGLPYILVGDWNCPHTARDKRSPQALVAGDKPGRLIHTSTAIDYALVNHYPDLKMVKGAKRGSDHPSVKIVRK